MPKKNPQLKEAFQKLQKSGLLNPNLTTDQLLDVYEKNLTNPGDDAEWELATKHFLLRGDDKIGKSRLDNINIDREIPNINPNIRPK
ncbi:hypothetical protein ABFG93_21235 (plasmid) [Pseudalkalibacillus hwajinpoensis]|uniref:hypothetical protein n=1 Tax=Guptibacillus hwajinpoensis TaxID=208199 RepID=UPI00325AD124